jgi:predicted RNA-binding protein with PUA-like domain
MESNVQFWLMKSEPEVYSIDHLQRDGVTSWNGVRNYQARNFMKAMKVGDRVLFYHSSTGNTGVAGIAEVSAAAHPDATQYDKKGEYFEPRATKDKPVWECADVRFVEKFRNIVPLAALRARAELKSMVLLKPGSRLSVQPVEKGHYDLVLAMGRK